MSEDLTVEWNFIFLSMSLIVSIFGTYTMQAIMEQGYVSLFHL